MQACKSDRRGVGFNISQSMAGWSVVVGRKSCLRTRFCLYWNQMVRVDWSQLEMDADQRLHERGQGEPEGV